VNCPDACISSARQLYKAWVPSVLRVQAGQISGLIGVCFKSSSGRNIEIEEANLKSMGFIRHCRDNPPQLAEIAEITVSEIEAQGARGFSILGSRGSLVEFALVLPRRRAHATLAGATLGTLRTGAMDTRHHCTHWRTTLHHHPRHYLMTVRRLRCPASSCVMPARRNMKILMTGVFMPKPNACAVCGPSLALVAAPAGCRWPRARLPTKTRCQSFASTGAAAAGQDPGSERLGGFLLACDANDDDARGAAKTQRRPHKPFALMVRDLAAAKKTVVS